MSSPYLPALLLMSYPIPINPSLQSVGSSLGNLGRQQFDGRQSAEEYSPSPSLATSPILSTLPEAFASNAADRVTGSALYDVSSSVPGASNKLVPEVQLPPMLTISIPFTSTVLAPMSIRYVFPNPQLPPPLPTKPYIMQADGKPKKSEICREFVAVETYTQKLLHDVTVLAKENQIMKEYLGNHELYFNVCLRAPEENIDLQVKMAVAVEIDKLQKGEGAELEDDDSDEDELEDDEVEKKKEEHMVVYILF
ncbi:hypothetical protein EV359DRAFT_86804 [Lentinula novae-zelandiae]|nr:hypothetical protein EV359DRAFT_86804 [Lentinula novae-zelandiae]